MSKNRSRVEERGKSKINGDKKKDEKVKGEMKDTRSSMPPVSFVASIGVLVVAIIAAVIYSYSQPFQNLSSKQTSAHYRSSSSSPSSSSSSIYRPRRRGKTSFSQDIMEWLLVRQDTQLTYTSAGEGKEDGGEDIDKAIGLRIMAACQRRMAVHLGTNLFTRALEREGKGKGQWKDLPHLLTLIAYFDPDSESYRELKEQVYF